MVTSTADKLNAFDQGLDIPDLIIGLEKEEERLRGERSSESYFERFFVDLSKDEVLPKEEVYPANFQCRRVRMASWSPEKDRIILTNSVCTPDCLKCMMGDFDECEKTSREYVHRLIKYPEEEKEKRVQLSPPRKKRFLSFLLTQKQNL